MDSMRAFLRGQASRGQPLMVFDWEKAARLIMEVRPEEASAGLKTDWEYTGGVIYRGGDIITTSYTYLASTWAAPQLDMDGAVVECWRYKDDAPGWDEKTSWPAEARQILAGVSR